MDKRQIVDKKKERVRKGIYRIILKINKIYQLFLNFNVKI